MSEPEREQAKPRDAATVVLLRDGLRGLETFLVRRHGNAAFMGGAHVFPGGKLDLADLDASLPVSGLDARGAAESLDEPEDEARARGLFVAAIRETFEEAGVLFDDGSGAAPRVFGAEDRRAFHTCVRRLGTSLRLDALVPYARWITPPIEQRRFDARFFLAAIPHGQTAQHDGDETTESAWLPVGEAVEAQIGGRIFLAPPTLRTLYDLRRYASVAEAIASARSRKPPRVAPEVAEDAGAFVLTLPGDALHSVTSAAFPGPTRMMFEDGRFKLP